MNKDNLLAALPKFAKARILVVGDIMLDEYIQGEIERISPEAPIPVVTILRGEPDCRLGGAANVFNNLCSLGGKSIFLCGIVGDDEKGALIRRTLQSTGTEPDGIVVERHRPTTVKTRIIAHHQQVMRLDREERAPISSRSRQQLLDYITAKLPSLDAIIFSDYEKGVISESLLREVLPQAVKRRLIVAVDPKFTNFKHFKNVTIVVPNRKEASVFARHEITGEEDVLTAARSILSTLECEYVLIKMGEQGMMLVDRKGKHVSIPATAAEVYDVTGAGDTVISSLTLARSAGASWEEAAHIANIAAGMVIRHLGTSAVELKGLRRAIAQFRF